MTRDRADSGLWSMVCDQDGCDTRSEGFPGQPDLELFQQRGWFIAKLFGDICPTCLAKGIRPGPSVEPYRGIVPPAMTKTGISCAPEQKEER